MTKTVSVKMHPHSEQETDVSVRNLRADHRYVIGHQKLRRSLARLGICDDFTKRMLDDPDVRTAIEETS